MTDFDYDVLQKKRLGYGARHMKRGSKSRRCSLPSDHLTAAQLKGRNGPVNTYNLEKPMTWEDFKAMPKDLQQSYIASLQGRFGVGTTTISKELFGLSAVSLRQYMTRHGLTYDSGFKGARPGIHWDRWLTEIVTEAALDSDEDLPVAEGPMAAQEIGNTAKKNTDRFDLSHLIVEFTGDFDAENFLRYLSNFPMPQGRVCIRMEVTAE